MSEPWWTLVRLIRLPFAMVGGAILGVGLLAWSVIEPELLRRFDPDAIRNWLWPPDSPR